MFSIIVFQFLRLPALAPLTKAEQELFWRSVKLLDRPGEVSGKLLQGFVFEEQRAVEQAKDFRLLSSLFGERGSCQSRHLPEICVTDLVPDEDRSWDSDDLTAQVYLGTSDIPDVLGGRHNGRTYKRGFKAKCSF